LIDSPSLLPPHIAPPMAQVPKPIREIGFGIASQLIDSVIMLKSR
jgi:hypothetical protein